MLYAIFTCDVWKSTSTFSLVGVATTKKHLIRMIKKLIKSNDANINGYDISEINVNTDIRYLNTMLNYLHIEEIEKNTI